MVLVLDSAAFNVVCSLPYWRFSSLPNFHTPHTHILTPSPWFLSLPPPVPLTLLIPSKLVSPRSCFCTFYLLFNSILIFTCPLSSGSFSCFQFLIGYLSDLVLPPLASGAKHLLMKAGLPDYLLATLWGGWRSNRVQLCGFLSTTKVPWPSVCRGHPENQPEHCFLICFLLPPSAPTVDYHGNVWHYFSQHSFCFPSSAHVFLRSWNPCFCHWHRISRRPLSWMMRICQWKSWSTFNFLGRPH